MKINGILTNDIMADSSISIGISLWCGLCCFRSWKISVAITSSLTISVTSVGSLNLTTWSLDLWNNSTIIDALIMISMRACSWFVLRIGNGNFFDSHSYLICNCYIDNVVFYIIKSKNKRKGWKSALFHHLQIN